QSMTEMDMLRRKGGGDDRQKVGAMHGQMRRAVERLAFRVDPSLLQGPPIIPAALMHPDRPHRLSVEPFSEPEPVKDAGGVRTHVDTAADLDQLRRLLIDIDREPGLAQRRCRGEPADSGADDSDLKRR